MEEIFPVLLAGGFGERLWPLSRRDYPKQFSKLLGKKSLFQESILRVTSSKKLKFKRPITLTNYDYRFIIKEQFSEIEIDHASILIEPESKNTAPAILATCFYIAKVNPEAILLVTPTDHLMEDTKSFHEAVESGLSSVNAGKIVTFGISPTREETGYGYLKLNKVAGRKSFEVTEFIEKPDKILAKKIVNSGDYLWNAGIFLFKAKDIIKAFEKFSKSLTDPVKASVEMGTYDLDFFKLSGDYWSKCQNISIDFAILEKIDNLETVPLDGKWSDLGDWNAVFNELEFDRNLVALSNNAHAINCENTMLRSESSNIEIVGIGLKDILTVAMPDAVLVVNRNHSQEVKNAVKMLKSKKVPQAETTAKNHRPWGWYTVLVANNTGFQVKQINVNANSSLSLQRHKYRSEHWVVVKGTATVTVDAKVSSVSVGQSVYIPLGSMHRLENRMNSNLVIIEVQTGTYLGEDDIERFEDMYART